MTEDSSDVLAHVQVHSSCIGYTDIKNYSPDITVTLYVVNMHTCDKRTA